MPLDVDALRALKLWLVHDGQGTAPALLPRRPELDPRWLALAEAGFAKTAWDQLLVPELWLPGDAPFTFPCPYPDGHEVQAGWVDALRAQLRELHERKLAATPVDVRLFAATAPGDTRDLGVLARHAAAVLAGVADRAAARNLPMLLTAA